MFVSLVAVICFVGYVLLTIYLGNGLIMLPYNLVFDYWKRPHKLTVDEMRSLQTKLKRKLQKMIDTAKDLRSRLKLAGDRDNLKMEPKGFFSRLWGNGGHNSKLATFQNEMKATEREVKIYRLHVKLQGYNPLIPLLELLAGVVAALVSTLILINL